MHECVRKCIRWSFVSLRVGPIACMVHVVVGTSALNFEFEEPLLLNIEFPAFAMHPAKFPSFHHLVGPIPNSPCM